MNEQRKLVTQTAIRMVNEQIDTLQTELQTSLTGGSVEQSIQIVKALQGRYDKLKQLAAIQV